MKEIIKIEGGYQLEGEVKMRGAKNATVALIPALILADAPVVLESVPDISDVEALSLMLESLNAKVEYDRSNFQLTVDPTNLVNKPLDEQLSGKLRASYYFMGALLAKYGKVVMPLSGGCYLGPRPIDLHLKGFKALGAKIMQDKEGYHIEADELKGGHIYLDFASVGATINIILAASKATGKTVIENAAKEPEIIDVANLLNKMGAKIKGAGTEVITIIGVESLRGCVHEIIPDRIVAGTYAIIAAAAAKDMTISNIIPSHLESLLSKLDEMGIPIEVGMDYIRIKKTTDFMPTDITTQPYPGFPTDLQQPFTVLLTQAQGLSKVQETIYTERFKHCEQLNRMGANISLVPATAMVVGQRPLFGAVVEATDLRCGAALVVAGLVAEGITEIHEIEHIDRGYDHIVEQLTALGAKVWREKIA